ncbi:MAG TPA: hypothetical protein H9830_08725 [Candidatus Agrococcus pullicola]|uniref:Uncharacterized protein n=1 Tax=Candidatus Agrococcus pullicola TaxID=2838429 RepID=A0A9D1YVZ8_9MICO|nr:hypothetical protein [Candidatus Agrococcus pullicola]
MSNRKSLMTPEETAASLGITVEELKQLTTRGEGPTTTASTYPSSDTNQTAYSSTPSPTTPKEKIMTDPTSATFGDRERVQAEGAIQEASELANSPDWLRQVASYELRTHLNSLQPADDGLDHLRDGVREVLNEQSNDVAGMPPNEYLTHLEEREKDWLKLTETERNTLSTLLKDYRDERVSTAVDLDTSEYQAELQQDPAYVHNPQLADEAIAREAQSIQAFQDTTVDRMAEFTELAQAVQQYGEVNIGDTETRALLNEAFGYANWDRGEAPDSISRVVDKVQEVQRVDQDPSNPTPQRQSTPPERANTAEQSKHFQSLDFPQAPKPAPGAGKTNESGAKRITYKQQNPLSNEIYRPQQNGRGR